MNGPRLMVDDSPVADIYESSFDGALLNRGFWLYVWQITTPDKLSLYYVGRTGDSSSANAQSPFNRMSQHLGFRKQSNALRRYLGIRGICPEQCHFTLVAYGPLAKEGSSPEEHRSARDITAAMEKGLAEAMSGAGYEVLNNVNCRVMLNAQMFAKVVTAFAEKFPRLKE